MEIKNFQYSNKKNKFKKNGQTYCLRHLKPIYKNFNIRSDCSVEVKFQFSTHVFTQERINRDPLDSLIIDATNSQEDRHHNRSFCIDRYNLSKKLPEIIASFKKSTSFFVDHNKKPFYVENGNYHIFLNIFKSNGAIVCHIKSAYKKDNVLNGDKKTLKELIKDKGI